MKNNIFIITLLFVLLGASKSFSQNTNIGLRAGATFFTLNNEDINDIAKYTMGLNLAIPVEFGIHHHFRFSPNFTFHKKGVQFEELIDGQEVTTAVKTNYLELPVLLKAKIGNERFGTYVFAAPTIGYATHRFLTEKVGDGDTDKMDVDFINDGPAQSQRMEFSAQFGIGGSVKAGLGSFILDVRYSYGLTDNTKFEIEKPEDWTKTTNRGYTISIGYMVPIGG